MNQEEMKQIQTIIANFHESKQFVPYLQDLEEHAMFWPIFKQLDQQDKKIVEAIINKYIVEHMKEQKTKWGELFKRFFDLHEEKFWKFRTLNNPIYDQENNNEFQELWKEIENDLFVYEWILTEKMLQQEKWLDKVISAFYNIVYSYFPKMNMVK